MFIKNLGQVRSVNWGITTLWDVRFVDTPANKLKLTKQESLGTILSGKISGIKKSIDDLFNKTSTTGTISETGGDYIQPPKAPFNSWFPATDIEEDLASVESASFEIYNTTIRIPAKVSPRNLHLTMYDDVDGTIRNWLSDWCSRINGSDGEGFVTPLMSSVGIIQVLRYGFRYDPTKKTLADIGGSELGSLGSTLAGAAGGLISGAGASVLGALEGIPGSESLALIQKAEIEIATYLVYPEDTIKFVGQSEAGLSQYSINFVIVDDITER